MLPVEKVVAESFFFRRIMVNAYYRFVTVLSFFGEFFKSGKSWCNKVIRPTTNTVKTRDTRWLKRVLLVSIENMT
jgi:hypothetical protein